jgi:hypothetical protein
MALAREAFAAVDGFQSLVYNRVRRHFVNNYNRPDAVGHEPDIDAFIELYFRDRASLERAFARPIMQKLFADHPNFMDTEVPANVRAYEVQEEVFYGERR